MKVAYVTGATGCVGRNLVEELVEKNWDVVVLHRKSSDISRLKDRKVRFQLVDLHDLASVRESIPTGVNAIFHVAANTSHWSVEREEQEKDNVLATRHLVQVALEKRVQRFIFTSTGATRFFQETDEPLARKLEPPYVRTKRLSELEVYYGLAKGLDTVILHPIIVVGAFDYNSYSQIFTGIKTGTLKQAFPGKISFCHARDIAAAHLQAYENGRKGERYVLGGTHTEWREFFQKIANKVRPGFTMSVAPTWLLKIVGGVSVMVASITRKKPLLTPELIHLIREEPDITIHDKLKAEADIKYHSRSLDQMIDDCYEWMLKERLI